MLSFKVDFINWNSSVVKTEKLRIFILKKEEIQ